MGQLCNVRRICHILIRRVERAKRTFRTTRLVSRLSSLSFGASAGVQVHELPTDIPIDIRRGIPMFTSS